MVEPVPIKKQRHESLSYTLRTNLNIWIFYATDAFRAHINQELEHCKNVALEVVPLKLISRDHLRPLTPPDVILVEGKDGWASKVSELSQYDLPFEDIEASLIVFGDESHTASLKLALRVGASDFLSEHSSIEEMMPLFRSIAEQKVISRSMGELLVFINTKGGNGATTTALNMAIQLADRFPNEVLLIDIDTQFGLVEEYLDLRPKYTMLDALDKLDELDESSVSSMVSRYEGKLHTIGFGRGQGALAFDKSKEIQRILPLLRQFYKYVIIDYSRGIEPAFSQLISPAERVFLVLQQNYMSLKNASRMVNTLRLEYGLPQDSLELVINRFDKKQSISLKDIDNTLPNMVTHLIPNDYKGASESANLGKPIVIFKKKSAISKAINKLTQSLLPEDGKQRGWFSKLFS
ncbi:AAA family ATPase [Vibrio mediterranei]|uniref:AAA family ATPase n=1 Tax=Vibrio mediterranei TaxID=689 RepID=UPI0040677B02